MNVLELFAKLTLDSSEYDEKLKGASSQVKSTAEKMQKSMLTITKVGAAAVGAFAVASLKTGAEFDSAMSQVAATMGTTVDNISELRDFAKEMGSTTAFSARQAAEALNYMALAGYDANTSMQMLPNVLNLAAAGSIDLARASDMITDAQSALGLTLEETTTMVDQMAAASSKSNTSVEQLGDAILTIGATARSLSGGTTELSTVLGVLADNSIKGAEGGTHLRNIILSLQTPTDDAAKALADLGVSVYDSDGNMRSLIDIMGDMKNGLAGMDQASQDAIKSGIFNKTDLAAVNALLNTSEDRFNELTSAIENSTGAAQAMADTQLDNLQGDITLLKSAFEGFQIDLSEKLMPVARKVVQWATDLITNFDKIAPIVIGAATAFGTFAIAINIGNIIKSVTTAFAAFNAILAANPIGIVVAAIAGLVAALVYLWNNNEEFRAKVTAAWEVIKGAAIALRDGIVNAWQAVVNKWNEVKGKANELKQAVVGKFNEIKSTISNIAKSALNWGSELISNFVQGLKNAWEKLRGGVSNLASAIAKPFKHSIPKEGPFKRDDLWGAHMIENFTSGMLKEAPHLIGAADSIAESVRDSMMIDNMSYSMSGKGYGENGFGGMAINGDVYITVEGTGKNAEQIGRDLYKMLINKGVSAYAY